MDKERLRGVLQCHVTVLFSSQSAQKIYSFISLYALNFRTNEQRKRMRDSQVRSFGFSQWWDTVLNSLRAKEIHSDKLHCFNFKRIYYLK